MPKRLFLTGRGEVIILLIVGGAVLGYFVWTLFSPESIDSEAVVEEGLGEVMKSERSPVPTTSGSADKEEDPPFYMKLLVDDCSRECDRYFGRPGALGYCRSVCGLTGGKTSPAPESLVSERIKSDLQKKSEAEAKLDLSLCAEINDAALRKNCEVRVTEDMLE